MKIGECTLAWWFFLARPLSLTLKRVFAYYQSLGVESLMHIDHSLGLCNRGVRLLVASKMLSTLTALVCIALVRVLNGDRTTKDPCMPYKMFRGCDHSGYYSRSELGFVQKKKFVDAAAHLVPVGWGGEN